MSKDNKASKSWNSSEYVPYTGNIVVDNDMQPIGPFYAQSVGRVGVSDTNSGLRDITDEEFEAVENMKITTSQDVIAGLQAEIDRLKWENLRLSALVESLTEAMNNDK